MSKTLSEELDKQDIYFKYCSNNKDLLEGLFCNHVLRFTQPWALNDPLEFNPSIRLNNFSGNIHKPYKFKGKILPSFEDFLRLNFIEPNINEYGFLSLTKNCTSFDMWNLYSNAHKGFLIEFAENFPSSPFFHNDVDTKTEFRKIEYVDEYNLVIDYQQLVPDHSISKGKIFDLFFKKSSRWETEDEYRMVRPLNQANNYKVKEGNKSYRDGEVYLFNFSLELIKAIAFGAHMPIENKRYVINKSEKYRINYFQSIIIRDKKDKTGKSGTVMYLPIDGKHMNKQQLLTMPPQEFSVDKNSFEDFEPKEIDSLEEIPFYKGNEQAVHYTLDNLDRY